MPQDLVPHLTLFYYSPQVVLTQTMRINIIHQTTHEVEAVTFNGIMNDAHPIFKF